MITILVNRYAQPFRRVFSRYIFEHTLECIFFHNLFSTRKWIKRPEARVTVRWSRRTNVLLYRTWIVTKQRFDTKYKTVEVPRYTRSIILLRTIFLHRCVHGSQQLLKQDGLNVTDVSNERLVLIEHWVSLLFVSVCDRTCVWRNLLSYWLCKGDSFEITVVQNDVDELCKPSTASPHSERFWAFWKKRLCINRISVAPFDSGLSRVFIRCSDSMEERESFIAYLTAETPMISTHL